ncbi:MAG TPA: hypothetical protein PKH24_00665 [Sedimentisphaerales bacterium]|jgi:hypothetical protein|nr:hypothetical protein [Sedimentisphaerales bacterium]HNU27962.1 hypothetical protein [Sedimentisphaerales bacterium]
MKLFKDRDKLKKHIGIIENIEGRRYNHLLDLKRRLAGHVTPSVRLRSVERAKHSE